MQIYPSPPVWSVYHLSYLNASQNDDNPIDSVINPVISGDGNQPSIEDQLSLPESISSVPYLSQGLLYLFSLEFRKITFHKTPTKRRKRLWHCLLSLIGHSHYNNDWEENDRNQKTLSITAMNEFLSESAESGSLKWKSSTGPIRHVSLAAFVSMCDLSMCVNMGCTQFENLVLEDNAFVLSLQQNRYCLYWKS